MNNSKQYTKEEVLDAIRVEWLKQFGKHVHSNDEADLVRDRYFIQGFVSSAIENQLEDKS